MLGTLYFLCLQLLILLRKAALVLVKQSKCVGTYVVLLET